MESQDRVSGRSFPPDFALKTAFYLIPMLAGLVYWLAFFPGVMSYDSVSQWDQFSRFQINNWHPAITTILMWTLTRLWYSPAIISLYQVIVASLVIGYGLSSIRSVTRLPGWVLVGLGILISANPLVGMVNVTLWKDVVYGYLVLLLTIFIFNIIYSRGEWIRRSIHFISMGIILALICLFRVNGFPVVLASLVFLFLKYRKHFKFLMYSSVIALAISVMVVGPLYSVFKVDRSFKQTYGMPFINPVVAYVSSKQSLAMLSPAEKQYLNVIYPLKKEWPYSCYDATVFFYQETDLYPVILKPWTIVRIFSKLARQNPRIALHHFVCLSSFVWQPNQPQGVYLETVLFDNYNLDLTPGWSSYNDTLSQHPALPLVHRVIQRLVNEERRLDTSMLTWRPALYLFTFLIGLVLLVIRTRVKGWLLLAVPLLAQSIVVMLTAQLQALRYQFPVYIISMVFTIPLFIIAIKNPRQLSIQEG